MAYISTRGGDAPMRFGEAVMAGMARDGGLLIPAIVPDVTDRLEAWKDLRYADLAHAIVRLFTDGDEAYLRGSIDEAYATFRHPDVAPLVEAGPVFVQELFHGPTLAFKDVALQWLGRLFEALLAEADDTLNILAATSGDTGSAAIQGVRGRPRMRIFVMHPRGRVSELQERQMTTVLDDNVFNLAVEGSFDDCQAIMKTLFADLPFKDRHHLGAVNSVNWARVLSQIVYYFFGAFRAMERTGAASVQFAIPTGNFGNILAGYYAMRMGLPIRRLILATNENDILSRFFNTGEYSLGRVAPTISPSMDIQVASNFERYLYYRLGSDPSRTVDSMRAFAQTGALRVDRGLNGVIDARMTAGSANTAETLETIRAFHSSYDYLLDPHTAVGVKVASGLLSDEAPTICLATAHPAKFPQAIRDATGRDLAHHPMLDALKDAPTRCETVPASIDAVRAFIDERV